MNLSFSILFMLLSSTATGAIHGSRPRSIQIVDDDCDDYGRCARTLYPPSGPTPTAEMDLPPEIYTFWQCGIGSVSKVDSPSCTCGISRVVSQPANSNTAVPIYPGEYLSEAACNAQCKRGPEDKCWVCVEQYAGYPGGGVNYFCQHKADAPFSYQGQPGMVLGGLNGCNRVCPRLKALPYELLLE